MTALARRAWLDGRRRTAAFAALFAVLAWVQPFSYRASYPTVADRVAFAHSFGSNLALRLFFGVPRGLLSVGGYTAWRLGGIAVVIAAVWAAVTASGLLRGEEDTGRTEYLLSLPLSRRGTIGAAAALTLSAQSAVLCAALAAGLIAGGLAIPGSLLLAAAAGVQMLLWASVGAWAAQLCGGRGQAARLTLLLLGSAFAVRIVADTVAGAAWLRWLSPLGWAEEVHPYTGGRPLLLLVPLLLSVPFLLVAIRAGARRDTGSGLIGARRAAGHRSRRAPGSVIALTLGLGAGTRVAWTVAVALYGVLVGIIAPSVSSAGIPAALRDRLQRGGVGSIATPRGYLGFVFEFFVLLVALNAAWQVGSIASEETSGRLDVVLAQPLNRRRWLSERLLVGSGSLAWLSLVAAVAVWAGASASGVSLGLGAMGLAGVNALGLGLLFLGLGAAVYAYWPRVAGPVLYAAVTVAYLWQLFGALLGLPRWIVHATPFAHLGLEPAQAFRGGALLLIACTGAVATALAAATVTRRDLTAAD